MTLADKALSFAGTTGTVLANFWPWILAAFLLGGVLSGYGTFQVTRAFYQRATLKAEKKELEARKDLSDFTATLATNAADAEVAAAKRLKETSDAQAARDKAIQQQIANIPSMVARQLQPDFDVFRSSIHADPDLEACLLRPMPPGALGVLRRPGGDSSTTESH